MHHTLAIERLEITQLRNIAHAKLSFHPGFNVIAGANGSGKTSLLEALYLVGTSRSFRTSKPREVVRFGATEATVFSHMDDGGIARTKAIQLRQAEGQCQRLVRVDGKRPVTLASFAIQTPVVIFHPGALSLTMGPSAERRNLLDRIALYAHPDSWLLQSEYTKALRARQKLLQTRGPDAPELDAFEALLVKNGSTLTRLRSQAAVALIPPALLAFQDIAAADLELAMHYEPSAPDDGLAYLRQLQRSRADDARRSSARIGPHRDELALLLFGNPFRTTASQGQHRALVLALKSAEMRVIEEVRGLRPVLLLDDVSSELDADRARAFFSYLGHAHGQVFITTTRPELIDESSEHAEHAKGAAPLGTKKNRSDFLVEQGRFTQVFGHDYSHA